MCTVSKVIGINEKNKQISLSKNEYLIDDKFEKSVAAKCKLIVNAT